MMNPMQIMQMLRNGNPQQMIINVMRQNSGVNPILNNAIDMAEKGDAQGLEKLCRNLGKERNVDIDQMVNQVKSQFGIK